MATVAARERRANGRARSSTVSVLGLLVLVGCGSDWPSFDADPGVYDGARDPLNENVAASRTEALSKRFALIQAPPQRTPGEDANE